MADHEDYQQGEAPAAHKDTHQDDGTDEISIAGLSGTPAALAAHALVATVHQDAPALIGAHALLASVHHIKYTDAAARAAAVEDDAYGAGWSGDTAHAPSQNALYDEIEKRAPKKSPTFTTKITTPIIDLSGGQIAFPAVQNPSAAPNTLDDYEEGTWTPVPANMTEVGVALYSGYYTKIGNRVLLTIRIDPATSTASTVNLTSLTLPFTPAVPACATCVSQADLDLGAGLAWTDGKVYTPGWAANGDNIFISLTYLI